MRDFASLFILIIQPPLSNKGFTTDLIYISKPLYNWSYTHIHVHVSFVNIETYCTWHTGHIFKRCLLRNLSVTMYQSNDISMFTATLHELANNTLFPRSVLKLK